MFSRLNVYSALFRNKPTETVAVFPVIEEQYFKNSSWYDYHSVWSILEYLQSGHSFIPDLVVMMLIITAVIHLLNHLII